jgi:hypothetical protein
MMLPEQETMAEDIRLSGILKIMPVHVHRKDNADTAGQIRISHNNVRASRHQLKEQEELTLHPVNNSPDQTRNIAVPLMNRDQYLPVLINSQLHRDLPVRMLKEVFLNVLKEFSVPIRNSVHKLHLKDLIHSSRQIRSETHRIKDLRLLRELHNRGHRSHQKDLLLTADLKPHRRDRVLTAGHRLHHKELLNPGLSNHHPDLLNTVHLQEAHHLHLHLHLHLPEAVVNPHPHLLPEIQTVAQEEDNIKTLPHSREGFISTYTISLFLLNKTITL